VSLLMDALRKAEQAKGGVQPEETAAAPGVDAPANPGPPLQLEEIPDRPASEPAPGSRAGAVPSRVETTVPPPVLSPARTNPGDRAAAQNAFSAKQALEPGGPTFAIVVGAATLLAIAIIGVYFWWQLRPTSSGIAAVRPPVAASPSAAPPADTHPPVAVEPPRPEPATAQPVATAPAPKAARDFHQATTRAETDEGSNAIRVTHSQLKVDPALTEGFSAFQAGDLKRAQAAYERALQDDPRNTDALRGAAAVALRQGRNADAGTYYRRLLEADPVDPVAQAGLAGLDEGLDPAVAEQRLKTLLAGQPKAAVLHFALGNLYARQSRWSEAQQAYFDAVAGDGSNPDYLYNLAISLDQMHKENLAAQYYRQALAAAAGRPAAFDQARAAARLRQLQP
jgi:tetratricopeptide (TPR) repeat protein